MPASTFALFYVRSRFQAVRRTGHSNRLRCLAVICQLALLTAGAGAQKTIQADEFVDSVGINVHLHYTNTLYARDFTLIQSSLEQLGVRHIRDGIALDDWRTYSNELNLLGQAGIKGIFIASSKQTADQIQRFESLVPQSFEGVESPNELDASKTPNWSEVLPDKARVISEAVAGQSPMPMVIGPSLVKPPSYGQLGSLADSLAYGNIHDYKGWKNPGTPGSYGFGYSNYVSNAWALSMEAITAPGLPVIATECGYTNAANTSSYVPESVAAVYLPRLLLEQYRSGIKRTYIYELLSSGGEDYGLLRADGSKKPAFPAVANLLNLLEDPGPSFTPDSLSIPITGADSSVHSMLFEKRNKAFYLAIWIELPRYDGSAGVPGETIAVNSLPITIMLPNPIQSASLHTWGTSGDVASTSLSPSQTLSLKVTDRLTVLEFVQK